MRGKTGRIGAVREKQKGTDLSVFGYELPAELIAQKPPKERDEARLLGLSRTRDELRHEKFRDVVKYLERGDVLVLNNSRVMPARLRGKKRGHGANIELMLLEESADGRWWTMMRPGKRLPVGDWVELVTHSGERSTLRGVVTEKNEEGHGLIQFSCRGNEIRATGMNGLQGILAKEPVGETPLPPYIQRKWDPGEDPEDYQTVYAREMGSVAAPTAGLHWTPALLEEVKNKGVEIIEVTLHVGAGTFAPVKVQDISSHRMHEETYEITHEAGEALNRALQAGSRIIAVGTTSLRVLEGAVISDGSVHHFSPGRGRTDIFIYPPYDFRVTSGLITNFHLPHSTLLMLVSAFAAPGSLEGIERVRGWYEEAIRERYRFFSYGDAMIIL